MTASAGHGDLIERGVPAAGGRQMVTQQPVIEFPSARLEHPVLHPLLGVGGEGDLSSVEPG